MKTAPTSTLDTQLTLDTPTDADIPERTHTEADWPAEAQRQHVSTADGALYHDMRANFLLTGGVVNDGKVIQSAMAHVDVDAIAARYGHMTSRQAEQRSDQRTQNLRRAAIQRDIALARRLYPLHLRTAQRRAYEPEPEPEETDSTASRAPFTPAATSEDDETEDEGDGLRRPVRLNPKPAERPEANQCWTHAHEPEPEPEETDITTNRAPFTPAATSEDDETEDEGDGLRRPVRLKPKPAERSEANRRAATHAAVQRQTTLVAFMPAHAARADALARADRLAANHAGPVQHRDPRHRFFVSSQHLVQQKYRVLMVRPVLAEGWGASTVLLAIYFYTDLGSLASARSLIYYHGTRPSTVALASH